MAIVALADSGEGERPFRIIVNCAIGRDHVRAKRRLHPWTLRGGATTARQSCPREVNSFISSRLACFGPPKLENDRRRKNAIFAGSSP